MASHTIRLRGGFPVSIPPADPFAAAPNCTAVTAGCQACVDTGKAAADGGGGGGCVWCPQEGGCVSAFACLSPAETCPVNYVWVVAVWLCLSALICLCCLTCTTRRCVSEWRHRLRASGARSSSSRSLSVSSSVSGGGSSPARRDQWWRRRRRGQSVRREQDSLYDPLLTGAGITTTTTAGGGQGRQQQQAGAAHEREEQEQEERALVFRNSLFAEAGEREWACGICAFENRPRVPACCLCGTAPEAGIRWLEQQQKHEEARWQRRQGSAAHKEDAAIQPPPSLSLRQRAARRRRVWQRRVDGEGRLFWVRVPLKEALALISSNGSSNSAAAAAAAVKEEEEEGMETQGTRVRWRRLLRPFFGRGPSPSLHQEEGEEGDDEEEESGGRRSSSSFSFSSLFRGSHDDGGGTSGTSGSTHQQQQRQPRRESEGGASFASFSSASPDKHQEETKEEPTPAAAAPAAEDDEEEDGDGGLGCFVSVMGGREGQLHWLAASKPQPLPATITQGAPVAAAAPASALVPASSSSASDPQPQPQPPPQPQPQPQPPEQQQQQHWWREADVVRIASLPSFRKKQFWFVEALGGLQTPWSEGHVRLVVSRQRLLEDSFAQLMTLRPQHMRRWMRVQFLGEPGVDAGGLEREWFILVATALVDPALGLFVQEPGGAGGYGINPAALHAFGGAGSSRGSQRLALQHYYFAGRVFGKALMEHQTLPTRLSLPLRKHLLGAPLGLGDVEAVDPTLHRSLSWLLRTASPEEVCELGLDFTSTLECLGQKVVRELLPGGKDVPLTAQNRREYVPLMVRDRLLESIRPQLWCLLRGFYECVPRALLQVFDYQELDLLLSGLPMIDVADWRRHTEYLGEYARLGERHRVIRWFWDAVSQSLDEGQRARLLQFTTGGGSVPAQGFKALQSNDGHFRRFNIQSVRRQDLLYPRAHTCFNKLDLPLYESREELAAALQLVCSMEDMATGFTID